MNETTKSNIVYLSNGGKLFWESLINYFLEHNINDMIFHHYFGYESCLNMVKKKSTQNNTTYIIEQYLFDKNNIQLSSVSIVNSINSLDPNAKIILLYFGIKDIPDNKNYYSVNSIKGFTAVFLKILSFIVDNKNKH